MTKECIKYVGKGYNVIQKSDLSIFDGYYFQTKPLCKLEILQKLLLLEFFFT